MNSSESKNRHSPAVKYLATSTQNRAACSKKKGWFAPVAQPGMGVEAVVATPTTGAVVVVAGCMTMFMW